MEQDPLVDEALLALDSGDFTLTNWEIGFLESMLKRKAPLTEKQLGVLVKMAEDYLDAGLAAELRGQQRLLG